jgi:hypothetical protein|tara:strand:+ start:4973 stop:5917 length:945 start_codon:yes stop_codon:yes gene_type:complete
MKKNYLFAVLFAFGMVNANAQFALDDMESYGGGNTPIFGAQWGSWGGSTADAILSSGNQAQSGNLSGYVDGGGVIDGLLLFGNKIFGSWGVAYSMYIPSGKVGYWNLQGTEAPGLEFVVGNIYMGNSGIGGDDEMTGRIDYSTADETLHTTFQFPKDAWFDVIMNFDFNAGAGASTWQLYVDGVEVLPVGTPYADAAGTPPSGLGAIDFYSISADNEYYLDDAEQRDSYIDVLSIQDLESKGFSAYPNPVKNVLNLQANEAITSAVVYNVLGQEVYNANINALNATIDMASFASGAYFVKVNVGGTEGVVKVLK